MIDNHTLNETTRQAQSSSEGSHNPAADLEKKLATCEADAQAWKEKFLRASADFQNYKKRLEKEQSSWISSAQAEFIKGLLPIVDDLDRAVVESRKKEQTAELKGWLAGFELIDSSLHKFLKQLGVQEITDLTMFNPQLHEAIASVEVPGKQAGEIVDVLKKGFTSKGEVLRPAQVVVAK